MTPQSVSQILKTRIKQAGLNPAQFSAHGLRSGYLTEAANGGFRCLKPCSNRCINQSPKLPGEADPPHEGLQIPPAASAILDGIEVAHMTCKRQFSTSGQSAFQQFTTLAA